MPDLGLPDFHDRISQARPSFFAWAFTSLARVFESRVKALTKVRILGAGSFRAPGQTARRCISATESPPPETATAPGHRLPSPAMDVAKRAASAASAAGGRFAIALRRGEDRVGGLRVFGFDRAKGGATFLLLSHRDQRLAELEHRVRGAAALRIFLDLLGEGARGTCIILLHIGYVAHPIDGLRRQHVVGMVVGEAAE